MTIRCFIVFILLLVSFVSNSGNRLLHFDYRATPTFISFELFFSSAPNNPTINIDKEKKVMRVSFPDTSSMLLHHHYMIGLLGVSDVTIEADQALIFIFKLNKSMKYTTESTAYSYRLVLSYDEFALVQRKNFKKKSMIEQPHDFSSKVYIGKKISLNFQNTDVRVVLQYLADFIKFNLVTSDAVQGKITLQLEEVAWDEALDLILTLKGLEKKIYADVLMVLPIDEMKKRDLARQEMLSNEENKSVLYTQLIRMNFAKAKEIAKLLKNKKMSLLSGRGYVSFDERTNTLLIQDIKSRIERIKVILTQLDIPISQVIIEARVVTVKDTSAEDLGVRWGINSNQANTNVSGTLKGAQTSDIANRSLNDKLNVNLPAMPTQGQATSLAMQFSKLPNGRLLDLELSALVQERRAEILASPKITTVNQKKAIIEQGIEIPYVESSKSGATSVAYKKAALSLEVTPQIMPDRHIVLDLVIHQDRRGDTVTTSTGQAISIDMQRIASRVLVADQETLVIGGIYQQKKMLSVNKVPFLGDLPLLGILFRTTKEYLERYEVLIFVTPKIVDSNL